MAFCQNREIPGTINCRSGCGILTALDSRSGRCHSARCMNAASLFEDSGKYNAIMSTLADILYHEMRRAGARR